MKRMLRLGVALLGVSLLAAGCGGGSKDESSISGETSDKLVWAGWSGEEDSTKPIITGMIDGFNADHQEQVSWVGWPWKDTQQQLIIRNQGSEQLDIAQVDIGMFGALSEMGILEDVSSLVDEDQLAAYEESALEVGQVEGQQLGMPWSIASIGMVYNPTLLSEVGYGTPPATIEEFEDCLKKLKEKNPDIIPYGMATKEETMATDFQPWLWTFGGQIVDDKGKVTIDNASAVDAVGWYKGLLDEGYIQMNITRFDARQLFAEGKMAFYDDAISAKGVAVQNGVVEAELSEKIRPMARPVLKKGDEPQSAMWGHLLVVFKKSANKEAAMELAQFVTSEEESLKYLESNGMPPVLKSAVESETVQSDDWTSTWLGFSETGKRLEFALNSNGSELNNIMVEELQSILLEEKSVEDGLASAKSRLEAAY